MDDEDDLAVAARLRRAGLVLAKCEDPAAIATVAARLEASVGASRSFRSTGYYEAGDSIDEFLEGFPSVSREQVIEFLEQAKDRLVAAAS
jgi:hypothetical protein